MLKKNQSKIREILNDFSIRRSFLLISIYCIWIWLNKRFPEFFKIYDYLSPEWPHNHFVLFLFYLIVFSCTVFLWPITIYCIVTCLFCDSKSLRQEATVGSVHTDKKICFRVVSRGMFPILVKQNLETHMNLLKSSFESVRFTYEVVTDIPIGIDESQYSNVYEVIVPKNYETKTGAKFKARALQYAIEKDASRLDDEDWIVHLDEGSVLTKSAVVGVINLINKNKHLIGQGLISYGKCGEVVNWMTTLMDNLRFSNDIGNVRFALKYFNRPIFNFKVNLFSPKDEIDNILAM